MTTPHGHFAWYELMSSDTAAAREFYTKVMGWGIQKFEGPMDYTMWTNNDVPFAGLFPLSDELKANEVPSHWLPYIYATSVDESTQHAVRLGATVLVPPEDIPEVGRFSVVNDPQGATFALYQSITPGNSTSFDPKVGEFSWHELMTSDSDAASRFYSELFGWDKQSEFDMGEMGNYRIFGQQGNAYGGMFNVPPGQVIPPNWLCYIRVTDINAAVERIKAAGGMVMHGPVEVPGGDMIAQCFDAQGAAFAVHRKAE